MTEREILSNIKKNNKNKSVIIVSHKISSVMHADLIIVMDNGTIIERGNHNQLLANNEYYKKLVDKQLNKVDSI